MRYKILFNILPTAHYSIEPISQKRHITDLIILTYYYKSSSWLRKKQTMKVKVKVL